MKNIFLVSIVFLFSVCSFAQTKGLSKKVRYIFPQDTKSEYTVSFPNKFETSKVIVDGMEATEAVDSGDALLRATYFSISNMENQKASHLTDVELGKVLVDAFQGEGARNVSLSIPNSSKGRVFILRGLKTLQRINFTYERVFYYGKRSIIVLEIGGVSSDFPTLSMLNFEQSVKMR